VAEDNRVNQVVVLKVLQTVLRGCRPDVVENGLQVCHEARPGFCGWAVHNPWCE
jgi:hypothetical protein